MNRGNKRLSREELIEKEKAIVARICNDDEFAYYFFHEKCRPLFSKILWTIFGNNSDYDELVNELYLLLKKPNVKGEYWHALKTFDYRTTLFDWIKTVAVRYFYNSSKNNFDIPAHILDTVVLESMVGELEKSEYRKYMWFKYVEQMEDTQVAIKLDVENPKLRNLARKAIRQFKTVVEHRFPEYYDSLFSKEDSNDVDIDDVSNKLSYEAESKARFDISLYLQAMPNERYRHVIYSLFIKDMEPEELASEMNTPVSNIYNIKKRALDQLRDLAIYSNEISDLEQYINLISDDIKREILTSLFIERASYETVCSKMNITEVKLKKLKKEAIKELRNKIFKAKS
ncbi:RNA polymerase sigma factor [Segatella hominis]|uniref:RNA polymerase sigma factor n=1 Tax=Segatella hominis TaxID=2518605 RepID=UPI003F7EBA4C